jgi:hypothetical protein
MNIYFIFPYRGVGGVPLLFLRFAESLTINKLAKCFLVDYSDGFMARNIRSEDIELICYSDDAAVSIPSGSVAIFQSMTPWSIFPALKIADDVQILFWNCYPFNLIPLFPGVRRRMQDSLYLSKVLFKTILRSYYKRCRDFTLYISDRNALVFMDLANLRTTSRFLNICFSRPVYVPVSIAGSDKLNISHSSGRDLTKLIRVAWVGRVVDFKYYSLLHALKALNKLVERIRVVFEITIVGSGDYESKLKAEVLRLRGLKILFIDNIDTSELDGFLQSGVDLLLAMGTSALEGAKLGIPTILLDIAYSPVSSGYCFKWLYEQKGFNLGDLVNDAEVKSNNSSLQELINELQRDYPGVSSKTFDYFKSNHEIGVSSVRLLDAVKRSSCIFGQLRESGLLDRGNIYPVFSGIKKRIKFS